MGHRGKMIDGDEMDAFNSRRQRRHWGQGRLKGIKRRFNKRQRKAAKTNLDSGELLMKRLLAMLAYAIIITFIITGYSVIFDISISGGMAAVAGYKLLWIFFGFGLSVLTRF